jgi:4-diphosphocytidyl-2-C-methyl-D-erythritol kinase
MAPALVLRTPCKINWCLYVLGKRPDGYHDILTLMQCVSVYDTLSFSSSETIELVSDMDLPKDDNLVVKAARALCEYNGRDMGARIVLEKEIPAGAGLGGGSSDAACTLRGLNALWALGLEKEELKAIGGRLGSDVPFFLESPAAVARGRGEDLTLVDIPCERTLLLVKPEVSVSTAWAYETLDSIAGHELTNDTDRIDNIKLIFDALCNWDCVIPETILHNDFEEAVRIRFPVIGHLKEQLLKAGASAALMSGSGSAVFGVFDTREAAVEASHAFSSYWHRVADTLTGVIP